MKQELERFGIKVELLADANTVSLYDNELEDTVCTATRIDKEKLYVHIPHIATCNCDFYNKQLSIEPLTTEVQVNTRKNVKKLALAYARARKTFVQTCKDRRSTMRQFNKMINDYRQCESEYKSEIFAYSLKKVLDNIVRQTYSINELGK